MRPKEAESPAKDPQGERSKAATHRLPQNIGRFEIQAELGRGMMGVVYLGLDPMLGRKVAVKTVSDHLGLSEEDRKTFDERFLAEARAAATLSHPGIIGVHDVGRDPETGTLYIALEYLQGQTLSDRLTKGRFDWREALRVSMKLAEALNHAHGQGVIHRDVKPANIMILDSGEPKLMDFGIARLPESQLTNAGQVFGTPLFMSPEQANGVILDGRSDLFSLGAVLYYLLTLQHGFDAGSLPAIITRVLYHEPAAPSSLNGALPASVDYIVSRLIAKSPERRYPDGRTVAEDIQDILAGRDPRHRIAWESQQTTAHLTGTLPPGALAAALRQSVSHRGASLPAVVDAIRYSSRAWTPMRSLGDPAGGSRRRILFGGAVLALTALVAFGILRNADEQSDPSALTPTPGPTVEPGPTPEPTPTPQPTPAPTQPVVRVLSPPQTSLISFGFEHTVRQVVVRIWVDDELIVNKTVEGEVVRKVLWQESHRGSLQEILNIKPGTHDIRVQVSWDGGVKTATTEATFEAGVTRRLEANLSGLPKDLSLQWK